MSAVHHGNFREYELRRPGERQLTSAPGRAGLRRRKIQPRTLAKNCPECGQPMTVRTNRATDEDFLGCSAWPGCKHTEPMPLDMMLRRQGHPELPGFQDKPE